MDAVEIPSVQQRARRGSTIASSKATVSLQKQRKFVDVQIVTGRTRAATQKPRRSCAARRSSPKVPRRPPVKRMPKPKKRARCSFPAGLERFGYGPCTNTYQGFTHADDNGASIAASSCDGPHVLVIESPGAESVATAGLPWLRPRRTNSIWDALALQAVAAMQSASTTAKTDIGETIGDAEKQRPQLETLLDGCIIYHEQQGYLLF